MEVMDFKEETDQRLVDIYQGFGWILAVFAPKTYFSWQPLSKLNRIVDKLKLQRERIRIDLDNYFLPQKLNEVKAAIDNYLETYDHSLETTNCTRRYLGKYIGKKVQRIFDGLLKKKAETIFEKTSNLLETGVVKTLKK